MNFSFIEFIFVMVRDTYLPHRAYELTKSKQKQNQVTSHPNWLRVLLFNIAQKQCNGIINRWLHCLTSESKWRFLVNNILMLGSAWSLVMAQIQFSLVKKIKIRLPEHSLTPHPLCPITSNFCLTPTPHQPPQSGRHICITPNLLSYSVDYTKIMNLL